MWHPHEVVSVRKAITDDLNAVINACNREVPLLRSFKSPKYVQKRLLYLFQCDLLPGITGRILELKVAKDTDKQTDGVSIWAKIVGYAVVISANVGMLFYIFLFALQQTKYRQTAWFRSFMTWLGLDIILVGSMVVILTQIVIPSFAMKDLSKIKDKLITNIHDYEDKLRKSETVNNYNINEYSFNAAEYLFVSNRIARMKEFKNLWIAKVISEFSTPWPRQSYQHVTSYSQTYKSNFGMTLNNLSTFAVLLVGGFIQLSSTEQEAIVYSALSVGFGYSILLFVDLYYLYPALIAIPVVVVAILVHFIVRAMSVQANKRQQGLKIRPLKDISVETHPVVHNRRQTLMHGMTLIENTANELNLQSVDNESCDSKCQEKESNHSSEISSFCISEFSVDDAVEVEDDEISYESPNIDDDDTFSDNVSDFSVEIESSEESTINSNGLGREL